MSAATDVRKAQASRFAVTATHGVGECVDCDEMRKALQWATRETCARMRDVACVAFATDSAFVVGSRVVVRHDLGVESGVVVGVTHGHDYRRYTVRFADGTLSSWGAHVVSADLS